MGSPLLGFPKLPLPHQPTGEWVPRDQRWFPIAVESLQAARTVSTGGTRGQLYRFFHLTTAHSRSSRAKVPVASWLRPILPGEPTALTPTPRQEAARFSDAGLPEVPEGSAGRPGEASREADSPGSWGLGERGTGSAPLSTACPPAGGWLHCRGEAAASSLT